MSRDTFKTGYIFPSSITADVKCVSTFRANARNEAREDQMRALYFQDVFAIKAVFTNFCERPGSRPGRIGARGHGRKTERLGENSPRISYRNWACERNKWTGRGRCIKRNKAESIARATFAARTRRRQAGGRTDRRTDRRTDGGKSFSGTRVGVAAVTPSANERLCANYAFSDTNK